MDIDRLNAEFGLEGELHFVSGRGGLPLAEIDNGLARARVSVYAGQLLGYRPRGQDQDLLFVSEQAWYETGKAIKGGVPVCWPWFGPDPEGRGRPAHGLVRTAPWQVLGSARLDGGATQLRLGRANVAGSTAWPQACALELELRIGESLSLALTTTNLDPDPLSITQALHSYFRVGEIEQVRIHGLAGHHYLDKVSGGDGRQEGDVTFSSEVDRIYTGVSGPLVIEDPSLGREIRIQSTGSSSAVVWNPWIDKSRAMADLGDLEYRRMVCVETANAGPDRIELIPGARHCLAAHYQIHSW